MKFLLCLFSTITVFSQAKPLELKIDSIKSSNTADNDREFVLNYHIKTLVIKLFLLY